MKFDTSFRTRFLCCVVKYYDDQGHTNRIHLDEVCGKFKLDKTVSRQALEHWGRLSPPAIDVRNGDFHDAMLMPTPTGRQLFDDIVRRLEDSARVETFVRLSSALLTGATASWDLEFDVLGQKSCPPPTWDPSTPHRITRSEVGEFALERYHAQKGQWAPAALAPPPSAASHDALASTLIAGQATTGNRIGPYLLHERVGGGAMADVYRATREDLGRTFAIKVPKADVVSDPAKRERFLVEARHTGAVRDEHVVQYSDMVTLPNGAQALVLEFLDGCTLADVIRKGRVSVQRTAHIALQLAGALVSVHAASIVHRDLKPANIFLVGRGNDPDFVKIIDFGVAKSLSTSAVKKTVAGTLLGTPAYMSPEQLRGEDVSGQSDVYSLGVVIFEMLAGRLPFDGNSVEDLLRNSTAEVSIPDDVPTPFHAVLRAMLAKSKSVRPGNMEEVRALCLKAGTSSVAALADTVNVRRGATVEASARLDVNIARDPEILDAIHFLIRSWVNKCMDEGATAYIDRGPVLRLVLRSGATLRGIVRFARSDRGHIVPEHESGTMLRVEDPETGTVNFANASDISSCGT